VAASGDSAQAIPLRRFRSGDSAQAISAQAIPRKVMLRQAVPRQAVTVVDKSAPSSFANSSAGIGL
jgi:hypothetical protein